MHLACNDFSAIGLDLITLGLLVVTAYLAYYTYKLWNSTREDMRHRLRAYLGVGSPTCDGRDATVTIRNFGQTPALDVRVWLAAIYCNPVVDNEMQEIDVPPSKSDSLGPLWPQQQVPMQAGLQTPVGQPITIDTNLATAMSAGTKHIYIFGKVSYWDIFKLKEHTTSYMYKVSGNSAIPMLCPFGNEAT